MSRDSSRLSKEDLNAPVKLGIGAGFETTRTQKAANGLVPVWQAAAAERSRMRDALLAREQRQGQMERARVAKKSEDSRVSTRENLYEANDAFATTVCAGLADP